MLTSILFKAIPFGLAIAISPGAAFFGIIQTSLSKGFKPGILFAIGIAMSDMLFIALCLWGLSGVMENEMARKIFSIVGGVVLIAYGIYTFFSKRAHVSEKQKKQVLATEKAEEGLKTTSVLRTISKGFLFNFINPGAWVLWLGIMPVSGKTLKEQILFFTAILCTIFCIDLLKSFFSGKIKNAITPHIFFIINRIIGVVFCVIGIYMIVRVFGSGLH